LVPVVSRSKMQRGLWSFKFMSIIDNVLI
jgi:hypothetical protein